MEDITINHRPFVLQAMENVRKYGLEYHSIKPTKGPLRRAIPTSYIVTEGNVRVVLDIRDNVATVRAGGHRHNIYIKFGRKLDVKINS